MADKPFISSELFRFTRLRIAEATRPTLVTSSMQWIIAPTTAMQGFPAYATNLTDATAVRHLAPDLYDFAIALYGMREQSDLATINIRQLQGLDAATETTVWKQLLLCFVSDNLKSLGDACATLIFGNFVVQNAAYATNPTSVQALLRTSIMIPDQALHLRRELLYEKCENSGSLAAIQLGVADYLRVEQELCCYVPGEVSHIENVMAKEYKERSTRNLTRAETTTELASEVEMENTSDTTSTTRHEMQNEVTEVLDAHQNLTVSGSVTVSSPAAAPGPQITANASVGLDMGQSSNFTNHSSETFAQEVTKRALDKIVRKTSEKRISKMLREFEEQQKHGYDNRNGSIHVTGIYRWVDKIYTNRLMNYGNRLIVSFSVAEPARWYKLAMAWKPTKPTGATNPQPTAPVAPETLASKHINSAADIHNGNWLSVNG
jgi:hypothetical protein